MKAKKRTVEDRLAYLERREQTLSERVGDTTTSLDEMFLNAYTSVLGSRRSPRVTLTEELRLIREHLGLKVEYTDATHKLVRVKKEKRT
jgi:hypothetical protein